MIRRRAVFPSNGFHIVKPFVVLAAKTLGPGPLRLKMVKLAHELNDSRRHHEEPALPLDGTIVEPTRRAA